MVYIFIVLQNISFFHFYKNYQHGIMLERRFNNFEKKYWVDRNMSVKYSIQKPLTLSCWVS